ncbi:MAG: hypothetical protein M3Q99_05455, partial [Acidobacteriota bacterium]|nr:hypothetical protein [Acidobacteriota bacterium]
MFTINIFHKKFSYFILAVLSLLLIASISFGSVSSPESATGGEKSHDSSSLAGLQNSRSGESASQSNRTGFLTNIIRTFFNGSLIEQTNGTNDDPVSSPESIFIVNNNGDTNDALLSDNMCADSAGNCTLRAAIQQANATAGTDEIRFEFDLANPTTIQLSLPGGLLISEPVTMNGPGARLLIIKGYTGTNTGVFRITYAATTATIISGLTVSDSEGHGINNGARLNLSDAVVRDNFVGIYNTGRININRLLVNNNTSGGIYIGSASVVNVSNTTITNNSSPEHGGGIHTLSADVTLNNVTISNNTAVTSGGGIYYSGQNPGIYVRNTIIAGNTAPAATGPDIYSFNNATGAIFTSRGNNLIGKSSVNAGFVNNVNSDKVGTNAAPINAMLGPLQNNGGQIDTKALLTGSPAKDAGNICVVSMGCGQNNPIDFLTTDQRGTSSPRFYESGVDMGAFETFYAVPTITSLSPNNWGTGRGSFELVVNGTNFVTDSVVKWNGQNRVTTFVSNTQIKAQILAADAATAGQFPVTVANPQPSASPSDPVNFTVADCSLTLNPMSQNFAAAGATGTLAVTTPNGCTWSPISTAPWITITAVNPTTARGPGTITFSVAANTGAARNGSIIVNGVTFIVTQNSGCTYTLSSSSYNAPVGGGTSSVNITTASGCGWTAISSVPWITVSNPSGTGNGTINFSVTANTGSARNGTITVAGQVFTINQATGCVYTISPTTSSPPSAGGTDGFSITTGAGCAWT